MLVGELGLDGTLRPVPGVLALAEVAARNGRQILVPTENAHEAAAIHGLDVRAADHLGAAIAHLLGKLPLPKRFLRSQYLMPRRGRPRRCAWTGCRAACARDRRGGRPQPPDDRPAWLGQDDARAAAPASCRRCPAKSLSDADLGARAAAGAERASSAAPPLASPRASAAALAGGGADPHRESSRSPTSSPLPRRLPEFRRDALETLREPLEDAVVSVARAAGARTFPARFLFVAAMNPALADTAEIPEEPAGAARRGALSPEDPAPPGPDRPARGGSGSLLRGLRREADGEPWEAVRARVVAAREVQRARSGDPRVVNAALSGRSARSVLKPLPEAKALLDRAVDRLTLSARAYQRVLRVARTIADLSGKASIGGAEVAEALRFRPAREATDPS